jgi:hypothetical protein
MENYMCLTVYCRNLDMNNARGTEPFLLCPHLYFTEYGYVQRLLGGILNEAVHLSLRFLHSVACRRFIWFDPA